MSRGDMTVLTAGDGFKFDCYRVAPKGARRGGVVVVMEVFGVNDHIKQVADGYADDGYEALAPALYDRVEKNFITGYTPEDRRSDLMDVVQKAGLEKPILDVQACIDALHKSGGKVGTVGYCWGGAVVWIASAKCNGLSAGSAYYGTRLLQQPELQPKCPVILHFGKKDAGTPPDKVEPVAKAHPNVPIYWYDAGHGFNCNERADYHEPSAKLARERTLELFRKHIG